MHIFFSRCVISVPSAPKPSRIIAEISDLSLEELKTKLTDLKSELFNLRFQHATNQLDNPMKIVETKKSIAKVMTVIKEKEMNA